MPGYDKNLYILAFDHRATLLDGMLHVKGEPSAEDAERMSYFKDIIYMGFVQAVQSGIPKENAAILVDEQFGSEVLRDAKTQGYTFCLGVEKSGQKEFSLEFGQDFTSHIEQFDAPIVKALVRYNPEGDRKLNEHQLEQLKVVSDYCQKSGRKFLVEPLVGPTEDELQELGGDKKRFDSELRPMLEAALIGEFQEAGVEVDIWKIEGLDRPQDYQAVVDQATAGGRDQVAVIVLGRGADQVQVDKWLAAGKGVPGVKGFAIGRTIFWEPLMALKIGQIDEAEAIKRIANNYLHCYKVFAE